MTRATSSRRGWVRVELTDLAKAGAIFRQAGFVISDDDPVEAYGHRDRAGGWRRMHATYPDGWRATLNIGSRYCSLSYALRLRAEIEGPIA